MGESNVENGINNDLPNINEVPNSDENGSRCVKREIQLAPQISALSQTESTMIDATSWKNIHSAYNYGSVCFKDVTSV